ncbi:MAG: CinA family protein [Pirellulaceae bacterium]
MIENSLEEKSLKHAQQLRDAAVQLDGRLVLAESCTAGRVAATLASFPGISNWLCGSFVVYRCDSKSRWLGIPTKLLDDPQIGPVSEQVTELLAQAAATSYAGSTIWSGGNGRRRSWCTGSYGRTDFRGIG